MSDPSIPNESTETAPDHDGDHDDRASTVARSSSVLLDLLPSGTLLDGKYRIDRWIASDRTGEVYEGCISLPNGGEMSCAIKVLDATVVTAQPGGRFQREVSIGYTIAPNHPNLVSLYDFGQLPEGRPYLVMNYVEGSSLRQLAPRIRRNFPVMRAIALSVLEALRELHRHGYIHRDISDRNILIGDDGVVGVAGFGLARRKVDPQAPQAFGYAAYMSREIIESPTSWSEASDLYAVGAVLFEALAGQPPFGTEVEQVYENQRMDPPPLPDGTPDDLRELVGRLMRLQPENRPSVDGAQAILSGGRMASRAEVELIVRKR